MPITVFSSEASIRRTTWVQGNFIGTNQAGKLSLANNFGVVISSGASANVIDASNVISGNTFDGVAIDGSGTTANRVEGNTIGANQDASGPLGNRYGVVISGGARSNVIGGTEPEQRNLISGNDVDDGVRRFHPRHRHDRERGRGQLHRHRPSGHCRPPEQGGRADFPGCIGERDRRDGACGAECDLRQSRLWCGDQRRRHDGQPGGRQLHRDRPGRRRRRRWPAERHRRAHRVRVHPKT